MPTLTEINKYAKRPIDLFTEYLCYPLSIRIVHIVSKTRITPNQLSIFSIFLAAVSAVLFINTSETYYVLAGVIYWLSYVFDCADGQLARYKNIFSPLGGFIDQIGDRLKEFLICLSLSYSGYLIYGKVSIFILGFVSLFIFYILEYYNQQNNPIPVPENFKELSRSFRATPLEKKISKIIKRSFYGFDIGEQTAVISLSAILTQNPYVTFYLIIIFGLPMVIYKPFRRYYAYIASKKT